ncbi:MAG: transcriptional repressor [Peptococcaceae bacterium]|nr:transcriptional repressor [Peptococcaceae bacterium]
MAKSQRLTKQKATILEILRSVESHPTAEWIYQEARKKIPGLSLGTVYRNLNQLRENGEILELDYGSSQSHFDGRHDNHYHFSCVECGRVFDVHMPMIKSIETKVKAAAGDFQIFGYRLEYYGLCGECRQIEKAI